MNAAQLHLMVVHLPVVGCLFALVVLIVAHCSRQELLFQLGYGFLLACAVFSIVAYYSGPPTYQMLEEAGAIAEQYVERHAILGQTSFVGMVVLGVAALSAFFQYWQEEVPSPVHKWGLLIATFLMCYILAWTAHLGGVIRHAEIRRPQFIIFPDLE